MNHFISTLIVVLLFPIAVLAQGQRQDRLAAYKVAYLTEQLQLSPSEAQKFWPIYNEYQDKLDAINGETRRETRQKWMNLDNLSDEEVEALIKEYQDRKQRELDLFNEYNDKFLSVLSARKVAKLYLAELQYKKQLLERLRQRQAGGGQGQRR